MKRINLAIGTVAIGLAAGTALYGQTPVTQQAENNLTGQAAQNSNGQSAIRGAMPEQAAEPAGAAAVGFAATGTAPVTQPKPYAGRPARSQRSYSYSMYGGPSESLSTPDEPRGVQSPHFSPLYKLNGVPDDIAAADRAREVRRNAAVEFGMYRRQFVGSTEFWMDHDRTRLAKVRYAMDEPMWHSIHPDYDWGDGGYMYNTAASVGGPQFPGSNERMIVTPPDTDYRTTRVPTVVYSNLAPVHPATAPNIEPAPQSGHRNGPLVASDR